MWWKEVGRRVCSGGRRLGGVVGRGWEVWWEEVGVWWEEVGVWWGGRNRKVVCGSGMRREKGREGSA